jgi:hypothetical protein
MKINDGKTVFDTENSLCKCKITTSQGRLYGFFTFIDWWKEDLKPSKNDLVQYWGEIEWDSENGIDISGHGKVSIASIIEVMRSGGKWSKFES